LVEAQGRYEDVYVKTPQGWRFKSRMPVLAAGQADVSKGARPRLENDGRRDSRRREPPVSHINRYV
jgi:hypothetical protein